MMYSEFVKATGCKDNLNNYKVFENLNVMYMNSKLTKDEIYSYGIKLVDNSKTAREIEIENELKQRIKNFSELIINQRKELEYRKAMGHNAMISYCESNIRNYERKIEELNFYLKG